MATIKVMSWNIQKMGAAKIDAEVTGSESNDPRAYTPPSDQTYILDYIVKVIRLNQVDIIGIMEVMGSEGDWLKDQLISMLKPEVWNGVVSSKQVGNPREEYIYLWKESSNLLSLNAAQPYGPSAASLINTIDDNSMAPFFNTMPPGYNHETIYDALTWNGYIKNFNFNSDTKYCYRVIFDKWNDLANNNQDVVLDKDENGNPLDLGLTQQQLDILKRILVQTDIILFPTTGQRSPFLLNLNLNNGAAIFRTVFALFHAPGPPSGNKLETLRKSSLFTGINNIGLSTVLQNAPHMLLMGDFNVTEDNRKAAVKYGIYHNYSRRFNPQGDRYIFGPIGPIVKDDVFAAITGAPINAPCLIADTVKTSLTSNIVNITGPDTVGASPYDKFFFKSENDSIRHNEAMCVDLISQMNPDAKVSGVYNRELAKTGTFFFKARHSDKELKNRMRLLTKKNTNAQKRLKKRLVKKTQLVTSSSQNNTNSSPLSASSKRMKINEADINASTTMIDTTTAMIDDMMEIEALIAPSNIIVPPDFNCSAEVFSAISDHLPISVTLSF